MAELIKIATELEVKEISNGLEQKETPYNPTQIYLQDSSSLLKRTYTRFENFMKRF